MKINFENATREQLPQLLREAADCNNYDRYISTSIPGQCINVSVTDGGNDVVAFARFLGTLHTITAAEAMSAALQWTANDTARYDVI